MFSAPVAALLWHVGIAAQARGQQVSKSTVTRAGKLIDDAVLRQRRLAHQAFVYVWLGAPHVHTREHGQVVPKTVIATDVRGGRSRGPLAGIGNSEDETFWCRVHHLKERGLAGAQLVISAAHCLAGCCDLAGAAERRVVAMLECTPSATCWPSPSTTSTGADATLTVRAAPDPAEDRLPALSTAPRH